MDFNLSEEQLTFQNSVRSLAKKYLSKDNLLRAHDPLFPKDVAKLFAKNGLMGITLPEEDGGQGGKLMDAVLAIEQVALVCPRSADVIQSGSFGPLRTFAEYATEIQKEKYLNKEETKEELIIKRVVKQLKFVQKQGRLIYTIMPMNMKVNFIIEGN